jgi:MFS family permease
MAHQTTTSSDHRWLVLALLCTAQLLVVLDATIVNIALPSIQSDLGFSDTNLQWVINAYVLTFGGLLLLGGRAADMFIRRHVFLAGLVVFVATSLGCGLSGGEAELIAGRALQGVGAALMSAAALSILVVTFSRGKERNVALGVWGATSGVAVRSASSSEVRSPPGPAGSGSSSSTCRSASRPARRACVSSLRTALRSGRRLTWSER